MQTAKKIASLFSVIRGYNILMLIIAQYLAAIFLFSNAKSISTVIKDINLLYIIISTASVVASGYIINNFYDAKADKINRPVKSVIDNIVSQETKLYLYFSLNLVGFLFGYIVSWKAALFFALYIFSIWFYSHKLKKYPIIGLIAAASLTITPFFVLFIYYKNFSKVIFIHASFLLLIILIRELIKNLENIQGLIVNNYSTYSVSFGEIKTKKLTLILIIITLIPSSIILTHPIEQMRYYFYLAVITLIFIAIYLHKSTTKKQYQILHNILKTLLIIGVFSLIFIDKSILINKLGTQSY